MKLFQTDDMCHSLHHYRHINRVLQNSVTWLLKCTLKTSEIILLLTGFIKIFRNEILHIQRCDNRSTN
jgi:hypothetical protein